MPDLRTATWEAFCTANRRSGRIDPHLRGDPRPAYISAAELRSLVIDDDWTAFDRRYPERFGLLTMSMPGVADDQALVCADWVNDCSPTRFHLLLRTGNSWAVVDTSQQ